MTRWSIVLCCILVLGCPDDPATGTADSEVGLATAADDVASVEDAASDDADGATTAGPADVPDTEVEDVEQDDNDTGSVGQETTGGSDTEGDGTTGAGDAQDVSDIDDSLNNWVTIFITETGANGDSFIMITETGAIPVPFAPAKDATDECEALGYASGYKVGPVLLCNPASGEGVTDEAVDSGASVLITETGAMVDPQKFKKMKKGCADYCASDDCSVPENVKADMCAISCLYGALMATAQAGDECGSATADALECLGEAGCADGECSGEGNALASACGYCAGTESCSDGQLCDGGLCGPTSTVLSTVAADQQVPDVMVLPAGEMFAVWETGKDGDWDVHLRKLDADGTPSTDFGPERLVTEDSTKNQRSPAIVALGTEPARFVVGWQGNNSGGATVDAFYRVYEASGAPVHTELRANTDLNQAQTDIALTPLLGGGFLILWTTNDSPDIRARPIGADGTPVSLPFTVNTDLNGGQVEPHAVTLPGGDVVVIFTDKSAGGVGMQRLTAPELTQGFPVMTLANDLPGFNEGKQLAEAIVNTPGGIAIGWRDTQQLDGDKDGLFLRYFSGEPLAGATPVLVNEKTIDHQSQLSLADGLACYVSSATPKDRVYIRRLGPAGPVGPETWVAKATLRQGAPRCRAVPGGGWVVVWQEEMKINSWDVRGLIIPE